MKRKWVKWFALISVGIFGMAYFVACGGGGDDDDDIDPCSGPVPCLTQDWGGTFYQFEESNGNPILINSDGNIFGGAGLDEEGSIIGLGGEVVDCYNSNITTGAIDRNPPDGNIDYWFTSVSGKVNICNTTLRVTNLVIEGTREPDTVATYVGVAQTSENNGDQTDRKAQQKILFEILNKMSSEQ